MVANDLINQYARVASLRPKIIESLSLLDPAHANLAPLQSYLIAAAVLARRPDVILDLGTGTGCSSATMAIAAGANGVGTIETFDLTDRWPHEIAPKLHEIDRSHWAPIRQHVGDLTRFDYAELLRSARSVVIFWDAHGFEVAEAVLGKILPRVCDIPHLVVCHDVVDNRFPGPTTARSYNGKRFWRGMDDWYRHPDTTNCVNIGWCNALVDQILPILDFCYRNEIELQSVDYEIHRSEAWNRVARDLDVSPASLFQMACFSLEGSSAREFPPTVPNSEGLDLSSLQSLEFTALSENGAAISTLSSGSVKIALPKMPWAYAAKLIPGKPLPGGAGTLVIRIKVTGSAAVGVLNKDGSDFLARKIIRASAEPTDVTLQLTDWFAAGQLLIETAEEASGGEVVVSSLGFVSNPIA
jgi:hypothetical protein